MIDSPAGELGRWAATHFHHSAMAWPSSTIPTWQQFVAVAGALVSNEYPSAYMFRGQPVEAWALRPSLQRLLPEDATVDLALRIEGRMLEDFRSEVHLHVEPGQLPPSVPRPQAPEWWAIMQHYGAPTRLLDWTLSPFVAAYFAVESNWGTDGAIYLAHARVAERSYADAFGAGAALTDDIFLNPSSADAVLFWYPAKKSRRLVAQQGFVSLSTNVMSSHDDLIAKACTDASVEHPAKLFFHKWIIPASQKVVFLRNLRAMNIAAHSLFPGLEGICRSAAETARLALVV